MMTTEQIQENYAIAAGYKCFNDLIEADINALDWHVSNVQKIYAKQVAEQTLKDAANELEIWNFKDEDIYYSAKEYVLKTPIQLP